MPSPKKHLTKAKKSVNDKAKIYMFVDGKQNYNHSESVMNGRIQYTLNDIPIGMHNIQFDLYDDELNLSKRSNVFEFAVVDDLKKQAESITNNKDLKSKKEMLDLGFKSILIRPLNKKDLMDFFNLT